MEKKEHQPILTNTTVKVLRNTKDKNLVIFIPHINKSLDIPYVGKANKVMSIISVMKELNRQYEINLKTGGPSRNYAYEILKSLDDYLPDSDYDLVKQEVFGNETHDKKNLEEFKTKIINTYFSLTDIKRNDFFKNEPNHLLWTDESWEEFKNIVFSTFIRENFFRFNVKSTFVKNNNRSEIETFEIDKITDELKIYVQECRYNGDRPYTNVASCWKWKNLDEYKRLQISGKDIYKTKHNSPDFFWIPLAIVDKRIYIVPFSAKSNKFIINDIDVGNIIALAPFDVGSCEIMTEHVLFFLEKSYMFGIIKIIDKTLNDVMQKILEKFSMSQFNDFKKF